MMSMEKACYKAVYDYTPSTEDQAQGSLVIQTGDVLEVNCPVELEGGTVEKPTGWLHGLNRRTGLNGYFPTGEYVVFVPKPLPRARAARSVVVTHNLTTVYFCKPILCACCKDFIWGIGNVGKYCAGCGMYVHNGCESLIGSSVGQCSGSPSLASTPEHSDVPIPLEDWTVVNVVEWLAVVNLHRYTHIFRQQKITGAVLATLDYNKLKSIQIYDEFHQKAILAAVDVLRQKSETNGSCAVDCAPVCGNSKASDHALIESSFSTPQKCHICCRLLLGVLRQGFQCTQCGLCCHRQCLVAGLPPCDPELMKPFHRLSFPSSNLFRMPLQAQFSVSQATPAPPFVIHSVEFLERAASASHRVKLLDEYRHSCPTDEIEKLKQAVCDAAEGDMLSVISRSRPVCVAGLLKKYLRELPDSVIPQHCYSDFINATKLLDDSSCESSLVELVSKLPAAHLSTLEYLITHLRRVCWPAGRSHPAGPNASRDPLKSVSEVFYEILLRPPWHNVMDIVHNAECHLQVVTRLLTCSLWAEQTRPPTPPPVDATAVVGKIATGNSLKPGKLEDAPWYWGSISRDEANRLLCDMSDGTFIVRDATDRTPNVYTLTIRKGGANRLVRICHHNGLFGFAEPYQFSSVVELINYYQLHSLSDYNHTLDTKLLHPISRFVAVGSKTLTIESLRQQYVAAHNSYIARCEDLDTLTEKHSQIMQTIQLKQQALEAFRETISFFSDQIILCEENKRHAAPQEINKVRENIELLRHRSQTIVQTRDELQSELNTDLELSRQLVADLNAMKPDIKQLGLNRDNLKKQLLEGGDSMSDLDNLLKESVDDAEHKLLEDASQTLIPQQYFNDERMWLVNCDREEAERLLLGREEGTFLIRPKKRDTYVLSIVKPMPCVDPNLPIAHCLINRQDGGYYGFTEPYYIHRTLKDLVLHYREESLFEHNDELDTKLCIPVRLNVQQLQSFAVQQQNDTSQNYVMVNIARPS